MTAWTSNEPITIEQAEALAVLSLQADEPSHIHIPRPSRVMRPATTPAPIEWSELRRQSLPTAPATS